MPIRVVVQRGPKGKKAVAFAPDWPGWSRGATTADAALELLAAYRDRYRPIAGTAGLGDALDTGGPLRVVAEEVGPGSTDFWGISFAPSRLESEPMDDAELEGKIRVLRACWKHFDTTASRVSAEMRRGPRGGGRDRDEIVGHVLRVETQDFARRLGLRLPEAEALDPAGRRAYRRSYVTLMRGYNRGEGPRMRSWNLPFLIRHTAFHTLDHAWEMQDKDLSVPG